MFLISKKQRLEELYYSKNIKIYVHDQNNFCVKKNFYQKFRDSFKKSKKEDQQKRQCFFLESEITG